MNWEAVLRVGALAAFLALWQPAATGGDAVGETKAAPEDPGVLLRYQAQEDVPYFVSVISQALPGAGPPTPVISRGIMRATVSPADEGLPYFRGRVEDAIVLTMDLNIIDPWHYHQGVYASALPAPYFDARGVSAKVFDMSEYDQVKQKGSSRAFQLATMWVQVTRERADALARRLEGPDVPRETKEGLEKLVAPVLREVDRFLAPFWNQAFKIMKPPDMEARVTALQQEARALRQVPGKMFAGAPPVSEAIQADFRSFADALEKVVDQLGKVKWLGDVQVSRMRVAPGVIPIRWLKAYLLAVPVLPEEKVHTGSEWVHRIRWSVSGIEAGRGFDVPVEHRIVHLQHRGEEALVHIRYQGKGGFATPDLKAQYPAHLWERAEKNLGASYRSKVIIEGYAVFHVQRGLFVSNEGWFERISTRGTADAVREIRTRAETRLLLLDQDGGERFTTREHPPGQ